jgi:hypothetical protein
MKAGRSDSALERLSAAAAFGCLLLLAASACAPPVAAAQSSAKAADRISGLWPDIVVSGGGGIGVGNTMDTNVFARLRLGGLFAYEPFVVSAGATGELGALAERGVGAELEFLHMTGPWLQVGASRVLRAQWMGHLTLGFAVFGVEWQRRFEEHSDAVLFLLRAPIGLWWFLHEHEQRRRRAREDAELGQHRPVSAGAW